MMLGPIMIIKVGNAELLNLFQFQILKVLEMIIGELVQCLLKKRISYISFCGESDSLTLELDTTQLLQRDSG